MPKSIVRYLHLFLCLLSGEMFAQTVLQPGDIAVLGVATDMAACGLTAESDEISFVCYQDIATGTTIDITDNAWEYLGTGQGTWGDGEGTIRMTRTGGLVAKGTVITFQNQNTGGTWTYKMVSPDINWSFTYLNGPTGGPINLETGGDQLYFMQGGTWNNFGGGGNKASYNGRILFGFNTLGTWATNSTSQQSNLHPDVIPCFHMEAGNNEFFKYTGLVSATHQLRWEHRIQDGSNWTAYPSCTAYEADIPQYHLGYTIPVDDLNIFISCFPCSGCPPYTAAIIFHLPDGLYNVVYTNGIDTFELLNIPDFYAPNVEITDDISYWILSIEEVGGCPLTSGFTGQANFSAPYNDPGIHSDLWICPNEGYYALYYFLGGTPETGGQWFPPLIQDAFGNDVYVGFWGPGKYVYAFTHPGPPPCPPDTASVTVHWVDVSGSIVDVGCDQNGTPYDITDDRIVVTLTVNGVGFGPDYTIQAFSGGISPTFGTAGIPQTFLLDPGTATASYMTVHVTSLNPLWCDFFFDIPIPGFCSDPCDYDMFTSVSGTDEICAQNCVLEPASLLIDINGGTSPFKMDFTLTAPSYPPWTFPASSINPSGEISICVDTVPAPVYDPISGFLIIPQFLQGSELTFKLDQIYDFYDCGGSLGNDEHTFYIYPLPAISTTTLLLCYSEAINIDLTAYDDFISLFYDVTWFDGDPFQGGEEINFPTKANLENVVELWAHVDDGYCENTIQVPFTILPEPDLDSIPPIHICQGGTLILQSILIIDAGNSMASYTFHSGLPPDSTNMLNPLVYIPADSTTIYVLATAGMCFDTLPIEINVEDYPDFSLQAEPCDLIQGTYSILFTSSADSIYATSGVVINNPTGQDTITGIPNDTNVTIEIINPTGLCKDTFLIIAPNCNCPLINQPLASPTDYNVCEDEPLPLLSVTVDPGMIANWYTVPSGGIPFLQNSLSFQPIIAANSIYYIEAFDPSTSCYSIRTTINLVVYPLAVLQNLSDPVICDEETINLNTLVPGVINGISGAGSWFEIGTNQPVSGIIQPQNGNSWYYLYTTRPGNCLSADTISALVNPLPAIDVYDIVCDDVLLTYQIFFTSDADIIVASIGNLVQIPGTDSFSIQDIAYDTDIQIDLQYIATGCAATIFQQAPNCSCPSLLQSSNSTSCSDEVTVDLSAFEGPGVNGTWQLFSTPAGSSPGTLNGSSFQILTADPGVYVLRFIRSIILSNCVDTAFFQLEVNTSPFADAGSDFSHCASQGYLVFSGTGGGSNITFSWQTTGDGMITQSQLDIEYRLSPNDITAGSVSFTMTATDQTGVCPPATDNITITIDGSSYYILDPGTQTYCDTSDIIVDLDALISFGTTGGEWFFPDTVSAPVIGSSQINPSTLTAGSYTIFYATSNAVAPCKDDTTAVNLIIRKCACPNVAVSAPSQGLCNESDVLDLNTLLLTSEPGSWSIIGTPPGSKPALITGTQFVTFNSDVGIYQIRFALTNPVAGCPSSSDVNLEVIKTPVLNILSVDCSDDLLSWQTIVSSSSPALIASLGNIVPLGNNTYRIENILLNTHLQLSASTGNGLCTAAIDIPNPDCECTLSISNLPDVVTLCPNETIVLEAEVNDPKGAVTSFWIVANDSLYQNTIEVGQAGTYEFVTADALGCKEQHTVVVSIYQEMVPVVSWLDITCPGDKNGEIILQSIVGGNAPYFISINGGNMQPINTFPYIISGLGAGNYQVELFDGFNCAIAFNVPIQSASSETLSLGPDQTILSGDSVLINPLLSFTPDSFYWKGDINNLLDPNQLNQSIKPENDQLFQLFAIDQKGCLYLDDLKIRVLLNSSIYVPTVFSPNGDGVNDILAPLTDPSITMIQYFEIYSRWGELVYSVKNFEPNLGDIGWDGTLHQKAMLPGVFVYRLGAINKRGREFVKYGDVTLLK